MSRVRSITPSRSVAARYRARDGREHLVSVERGPERGWMVVDLHAGTRTVVEALTGRGDGPRQARALARDYASEKQAYHDGLRLGDPLRLRARDERPRAA